MKDITEIQQKIVSAQKDLAELDARRSSLLELIEQLKKEKHLIDKAATSLLKDYSHVSNQSSEAEKIFFSGAFLKGGRMYTHEDSKAEEQVKLATSQPVETNG